MDDIAIRDAQPRDLPQVAAILNAEILAGTASWALTPQDDAQVADWFETRRAAGYPVLAAERAGALAGYGALGPFRPYGAYRHTAELSLYVAEPHRRRNVGGAILTALEARARLHAVHALVAAIGSENDASIALHGRHGFAEIGRMPQVGRKFGRWLDLVLMQKLL
ncbi:MAG: N-acetyltransferase family protein [Rubrimonas sp.]|uniref:GNAT family N-acetyltransferase n=1 Tax=Rubrimonas sp. TaxID=2036015 RepID=UPI002FDEEB49